MEQIGKYQVIKQLGAGGFGAVYLAEDKLGERVAIKVFSVEDATLAILATSSSKDAENVLKKRFLEEARILSRLDSKPHIVSIKDYDELTDKTPYYVMPYLATSLADEIGKDCFSRGAMAELPGFEQPKQLPLQRCLHILLQILTALDTVHKSGLVHRDIKPANILLDLNGDVQICDFGIAKLPDAEHSQSGVGMGSRNYMSPEQRESAKHVGPGSDLYSVGILAYRMLTGYLPGIPFKSAKHCIPALPDGIDQLISLAISQNEEDRPRSAQAMIQVVRSCLGETPIQSEDQATRVISSFDNKAANRAEVIKNELLPLRQQIQSLLNSQGKICQHDLPVLEALAALGNLSKSDLHDLVENEILIFKQQQAYIASQISGAKNSAVVWDSGYTGINIGRINEPSVNDRLAASFDKKKKLMTRLKLSASFIFSVFVFMTTAYAGFEFFSFKQALPTINKVLMAKQNQDNRYLDELSYRGDYFYGNAGLMLVGKNTSQDVALLVENDQQDNGAAQHLAVEPLDDEYLLQGDIALQSRVKALLKDLAYEVDTEGFLELSQKALHQFQSHNNLPISSSLDTKLVDELVKQVFIYKDKREWKKARKNNSIDSYKQYLVKFSNGYFVEQAKKMKAKLKLTQQHIALNIKVTPHDAKIELLNINTVYEPNMRLAAGRYQVKVSKRYFDDKILWLDLKPDTKGVSVDLKRSQVSETLRNLVNSLQTISAGEYVMGCSERDSNCDDNEKPRHVVKVDAFLISAFEVTKAQFSEFVRESAYISDAELNAAGYLGCKAYDKAQEFSWQSGTSWRNPGFFQQPNAPVVCVSQRDALAFISWLSLRTDKQFNLPTEAQWEYAARGGSKQRFSFGSSFKKLCQFSNIADRSSRRALPKSYFNCEDKKRFTAPVGIYKSNLFNLHDMQGNVLEWTTDCWNDSYVKAPSDTAAWSTGDCTKAVVRGGSWAQKPWYQRSSARNWSGINYRSAENGFRVVSN